MPFAIPPSLSPAASRLTARGKAAQQRVVAKHADRARYAARALMNQCDRFSREQPRRVAAGRPDPRRHERRGFGQRQRRNYASKRDPLLQLPQPRLVQAARQLRLAGKDEGKQLLGGGFDVRQEPHFLEELVSEALRNVREWRV